MVVSAPVVAQERVEDIGQADGADSQADDRTGDDAIEVVEDNSLAWPPPEDVETVLLDPTGDEGETDGEPRLLTEEEVPSSTAIGEDLGPTGPPRPRPGSTILNRRCRFYSDADSAWVLIRFLDEPDLPEELPRWALPCRILEQIEDVIAEDPATVFRVSGENTIHDGKLFLLIRRAAEMGVDEAPPLTDEDARAEAAADDVAAADEPEDTGDESTDDQADGEVDEASAPPLASSDEVMDQLWEDRPGQPILPPTSEAYTDREQPDSQAPQRDTRVFHPGMGSLVVDRLVAILPVGVGNWTEAVFEADNTGNEPPIRLLPCHMLPALPDGDDGDAMAESIQRYVISGEILEYRGRRYLLLRKCLPLRDMDQF